MIFSTMQKTQQSGPAEWALGHAQAITLHTGPGPRWLHITEGRAWVTQGATEDGATSIDNWLDCGDMLWAAEGAVLVIEAWPTARFELLVPPQACKAQTTAAEFMHRLAQSVRGIWPRRSKPSTSVQPRQRHRVLNLCALKELVQAARLQHPSDITARHIVR